MGPHLITTDQQARALADTLLDPSRQHPIVVVSMAASESEPYVDADQLAIDLEGLATVHVLATTHASWALHDQLPERCDVYGGAGRCYPPGWDRNPTTARLRFAYGRQDRDRATANLTRDALAHARSTPDRAPRRATTPARGTLLGVAGGRGLVTLTDGSPGPSTIWPELIADAPADRLLAPGMTVWGDLDLTSRRLDVTAMRIDLDQALADYTPGAHVLARVAGLEADHAVVQLHPEVSATLPAEHLPSQDAAAVLTAGETLVVTIEDRPETSGSSWTVRLAPSDTDPLTAPAVLVGGPPWLVAPDDEPATAPGAPVPDAEPQPESTLFEQPDVDERGTHDERPDPLQTERDHLLEELRRARATIHALEKTAARQRTDLRNALERADRLARDANAGSDALALLDADTRRFADPSDQLRFEVDLAWARRTTAEEKPDLPLAAWTLSGGFMDTLSAVEGIDRAKVVDVIVDVLTGRAWQIEARQVHQLRTSEAGNAPTVVRDDGAICWRANLQTKTASARRLHWWQLPSGAIEISAVRLHDDVRP